MGRGGFRSRPIFISKYGEIMSIFSDVESAINDVGQFVEDDLAPVAEDIVGITRTIEGTTVETRTEDGRVVTTTSSPTPEGTQRQSQTTGGFGGLLSNPLVLLAVALFAFKAVQ